MELTTVTTADAGGEVKGSVLSTDLHLGTHVDAPLHFIAGGAGVEEVPLEVLVGPAEVAWVPVTGAIGPADLDRLGLPEDTVRVLLRTANSALWSQPAFQSDFTALSPEGADWIVDRGIRLVGIDYLSIQRWGDSARTHRVLLGAGVVILEGLCLQSVAPGRYELLCLPVLIPGAEAAPARTLLRTLDPGR